MNDRYISSAKRIYVTIVTVCVSITYLGWLEKLDTDRFLEFGYIEKLLEVKSNLTKGFESGEFSVGADIEKVDLDYAFVGTSIETDLIFLQTQKNIKEQSKKDASELVGKVNKLQEDLDKLLELRELGIPNSRTFTNLELRSDPSRECGFMVTRGTEATEFSQKFLIPLESEPVSGKDVYFVRFFWRCGGLKKEKLQAVFIDRRKKHDQWYVELSESGFEDLRVLGDVRFSVYRWNIATPDLAEFLETFFEEWPKEFQNVRDQLLVTGVHAIPISKIESKVLIESYGLTGKLYSLENIDQAMTEVLSRDRTGKIFWGVTGRVDLIVGISPLFLLGLLFTLLHRLRRIAVDQGQINEPWILIDTRDRIEGIFKVASAAALPLSLMGTWWAVFLFTQARLPTFQDLLSMFTLFDYGFEIGVRAYLSSISVVALIGSALMILNTVLVWPIFHHIRRISRLVNRCSLE